jgi:hypothetical protein
MRLVADLPGVTFTLPSSTNGTNASLYAPSPSQISSGKSIVTTGNSQVEFHKGFDRSNVSDMLSRSIASSHGSSKGYQVGLAPNWLALVARQLVEQTLHTICKNTGDRRISSELLPGVLVEDSANHEQNLEEEQDGELLAPCEEAVENEGGCKVDSVWETGKKSEEIINSTSILNESKPEPNFALSKRLDPHFIAVNTPPLTPMLPRPRELGTEPITAQLVAQVVKRKNEENRGTETPPASPNLDHGSQEPNSNNKKSSQNSVSSQSKRIRGNTLPSTTPFLPSTEGSEEKMNKKRKKLASKSAGSSPIPSAEGGYLSTCYSCQNDYLSPFPVARGAAGRHSVRRAAAMTAWSQHDTLPTSSEGSHNSYTQGMSNSTTLDAPLCPVCSDLFDRHGLRCTACYFVPAENVVDDGQFKCERCFGGTYCGSRM